MYCKNGYPLVLIRERFRICDLQHSTLVGQLYTATYKLSSLLRVGYEMQLSAVFIEQTLTPILSGFFLPSIQ